MITRLVLSGVLIVAAVWDIRESRVPHAITWTMLLGATAFRTWKGAWLLPVLLLGLILVEKLPVIWRIPAVAILVGVVQSIDPTMRFIAPWWGMVYGLWMLNLLGGADVRMFMALVAFYPRLDMVAALSGGLMLVGVGWLIWLYRSGALDQLILAGKNVSHGQFPSREELEEQGRLMTPGLVLGALVFLWTP